MLYYMLLLFSTPGFNKTCINKVTDENAPGRDDVNFEGMNQGLLFPVVENQTKLPIFVKVN